MPGKEAQTFRAKVLRVWIMYVIDVPSKVSKALEADGPTPVVLTVEGSSPRKTTMTPRKGGGHRVHVHSAVRKETGVGAGDVVKVVLRRDTEPRGVEPPPDLTDALHEAGAYEAFRGMGPAHQRELVAWLEQAVRDETRMKRVARIVERACAAREKQVDRAPRDGRRRAARLG